MKKIFRPIVLLASFGVPLLAAAQAGINVSYLQGYSNSITSVINYVLVPVLMAVAFIVFLWGVYKYFILGAADPKSQTDGKQFTLWGVIGFVVILSLWGIVNIFMSTLGLSVGTAPAYPTIGNVGGSQNTTGSSVPGLPSSGASTNLGTEGRSCPCATGFTCDSLTNVCTLESSSGGTTGGSTQYCTNPNTGDVYAC